MGSLRFMSSSLASLVNNLAVGFLKDKLQECRSNLEYMTINEGSLVFRYEDCNIFYEKEFDEDLTKIFKNTFKFCDGDINKFLPMLLKGN